MFFDVFFAVLAALIVFGLLMERARRNIAIKQVEGEFRAQQYINEQEQKRWQREQERQSQESAAKLSRVNAKFEVRDRAIFDQMIKLDIPQIQPWATFLAKEWGWPEPDFGDRPASCVCVPFDDPKIIRAGELNSCANASRNAREFELYGRVPEYGLADMNKIDELIAADKLRIP